MHQLGFFCFEPIHPQLTGILSFRTPTGNVDFRVTFLKSFGPLAANTIMLAHAHHHIELALGDWVLVV